MAETHRLEQIAQELARLREVVQALEEQINRIITDHPYIIHLVDVQGGEPIVRDKGVTVRTIVAFWRQALSPEQIVEEYGGTLTPAEVYDAISYYYDHTAEIENHLARHREALVS